MGFKGEIELSCEALEFGPQEGFWQLNIQDEFVIKFVISGSRRNMEIMSLFKNPKMSELWEKAIAGEMEAVETSLREMKETEEKFSPRIVNQTAQRLHQRGQAKNALQLFKLNAAFYPEESWVISQLALSHRENGDIETSKSVALKALEIDPQNTLAIELLK